MNSHANTNEIFISIYYGKKKKSEKNLRIPYAYTQTKPIYTSKNKNLLLNPKFQANIFFNGT